MAGLPPNQGGWGPPPPQQWNPGYPYGNAYPQPDYSGSYGFYQPPPPQPQPQAPPPQAAPPVGEGAKPQGGGGGGGLPYIGAKISLISNMNIRYEGILYTIDPVKAEVALQNVRCFGTEGRAASPEHEVPASSQVYRFLIFGGNDIKDLHVSDAPPQQPTSATATTSSAPTSTSSMTTSTTSTPTSTSAGMSKPSDGEKPTPASTRSDNKKNNVTPKPQTQREQGKKKQPSKAPISSQPKRPSNNPWGLQKSDTSSSNSTQASSTTSTTSTTTSTSSRQPNRSNPRNRNSRNTAGSGTAPAVAAQTAGTTSGPPRVPGQLKASTVEPPAMEDFDFEASTKGFDKDAFFKQMAAETKKKPTTQVQQDATSTEGEDGGGLDSLLQSLGDMQVSGGSAPAPKYNKSKSFFDELTTDADVREATSRDERRTDEDLSTFGDSARGYRSEHSNYRGRGGRRRNYNRRRGGRPRHGHQRTGT